jgi:hypothetical protein
MVAIVFETEIVSPDWIWDNNVECMFTKKKKKG